MINESLFRKIDCIRLYVSNLDAGLAFYRDQLGHPLIWRTEKEAGLRIPQSEAELVLQTERPGLEVDITVPSADEAAARWAALGGKVLAGPFDIRIGRCVVVQDPWSNPLVLLDTSKGLLITDEQGNVIGNEPIDESKG
jgi:predicted enzyme related to lactoylglutathione lyase